MAELKFEDGAIVNFNKEQWLVKDYEGGQVLLNHSFDEDEQSIAEELEKDNVDYVLRVTPEIKEQCVVTGYRY